MRVAWPFFVLMRKMPEDIGPLGLPFDPRQLITCEPARTGESPASTILAMVQRNFSWPLWFSLKEKHLKLRRKRVGLVKAPWLFGLEVELWASIKNGGPRQCMQIK